MSLALSQTGQLQRSPGFKQEARSLALCSEKNARDLLEFELATKLNCLPISFKDRKGKSTLQIAVAKGSNSVELLQALRFATECEVTISECNSIILSEAIYIAYKGDEVILASKLERVRSEVPNSSPRNILSDLPESDAVIPTAVLALLEHSVARRASDIHLIPKMDGLTVRLRVNGQLLEREEAICSIDQGKRLISRIKVLAGLDCTKHEVTQEGALKIETKAGVSHFRLSVMPTIHGERVILRLVDSSRRFSLSELSFHPNSFEKIREFLSKSSGLGLVSGPTGSGKTTTLYSMLSDPLLAGKNIYSLEDPVEAILQSVSQTAVDGTKKLSYRDGLKALLRQDPNVIMLGELRDPETLSVAVDAALTGHIILSTIHAGSALEVFTRVTQMLPTSHGIAGSLGIIVFQRLIATLCSRCKQNDFEAEKLIGIEGLYKSTGCLECDHSGYGDRRPITEIIKVDDLLRKTIECRSNLSEISRYLSIENYLSPYMSLDYLLLEGSISLEEYSNFPIPFYLNNHESASISPKRLHAGAQF